MPHFSKRITNNTEVLEFHFDRISRKESIKYHVAVTARGSVYHFTMEPKSGDWKIVSAPLPPQWILEFEDRLAAEILLHLKSF